MSFGGFGGGFGQNTNQQPTNTFGGFGTGANTNTSTSRHPPLAFHHALFHDHNSPPAFSICHLKSAISNRQTDTTAFGNSSSAFGAPAATPATGGLFGGGATGGTFGANPSTGFGGGA